MWKHHDHYEPLDDLALLGILILAVWLVGVMFEPIKSALVGELTAGMILGPHCLDLIAHESAVHVVGQFGLCMLVLEGGLSIEGHKIRLVGAKAGFVSVTGAVFPLLLGWATLFRFGYGMEASMVGGLCTSSTSIGIATRLLREAGELNTEMGSIITVAAMADDVLSLILLAIIAKLSTLSGTETVEDEVRIITEPIIASIGILVVGYTLANYVTPPLVNWLRVKFDKTAEGELKKSPPTPRSQFARFFDMHGITYEDLLMVLLLTSALVLTVAAGKSGTTHLLGTFVAGSSLSHVPELEHIWDKQCSVCSRWVSAIFFASIGSLVPVRDLFSLSAVVPGTVFILTSIFSKWISGAYMCCGWQPAGGHKGFHGRWRDWNTVGWAMVGRGELGLAMIVEAKGDGLLGGDTFAVVLWGLLLPTLLSPFFFHYHLDARVAEAEKADYTQICNDVDCCA